MKRTIFILLAIFSTAFGQHRKIDSLENELINSNLSPTGRIHILNEISYLSYRLDLDKTTRYATKAIQLAKETGFTEELGESYRCIGITHLLTGNLDSALTTFDNSLELFKKTKDENGIARVLGNIGLTMAFQGNLNSALEYYFNSLEILDKLGDQHRQAITYNNIGEIHLQMKNYNDALIYFENQLPIFNHVKDTTHILMTTTNLAKTHMLLGNYDKAEKFCDLGISIAFTGNSPPYICGLCTIKGEIALFQNHPKEAYNYLTKAIKYANASTDIEFKWRPFYEMARYYFQIDDYARARAFYQESLNISTENNLPEGIKDATEGLYKVAETLGKFEEAFKYLSVHKKISDKLLSESNIKKVTTLEMQHIYEENQRVQEIKRQKQNLLLHSLLAGFGLFFILALIIIRQNRVKTKINRKLETANATKDKFLGIIAHDLKNPVSSLLCSSELVAEEYDTLTDIERTTLINGFYNGVKNINRLLERLLLWANSQRDIIEINKEKIQLKTLVDNSILPHTNSLQNKSITITNHISGDTICYCDKNTIETVLNNLINNSIKFTNDNGAITISSHENNEFISIEVEDNGIGMDDETLEKLFNISATHTTKGTRNETGTGLGLFICKEFVEKNGGEIWARSKLGKGSILTFTIPKE